MFAASPMFLTSPSSRTFQPDITAPDVDVRSTHRTGPPDESLPDAARAEQDRRRIDTLRELVDRVDEEERGESPQLTYGRLRMRVIALLRMASVAAPYLAPQDPRRIHAEQAWEQFDKAHNPMRRVSTGQSLPPPVLAEMLRRHRDIAAAVLPDALGRMRALTTPANEAARALTPDRITARSSTYSSLRVFRDLHASLAQHMQTLPHLQRHYPELRMQWALRLLDAAGREMGQAGGSDIIAARFVRQAGEQLLALKHRLEQADWKVQADEDCIFFRLMDAVAGLGSRFAQAPAAGDVEHLKSSYLASGDADQSTELLAKLGQAVANARWQLKVPPSLQGLAGQGGAALS